MTVTAPITTVDRSQLHKLSWSSPSWIDRVAAHLGVALVQWAEARAARASLSHEEAERAWQQQEMALRREVEAHRLTQRIGF